MNRGEWSKKGDMKKCWLWFSERVDEDDVKLGVSSEVHGVEVVSGMTGELKE